MGGGASGFRFWGLGFWGFRVWSLGFGVEGLGFRAYGLRFRAGCEFLGTIGSVLGHCAGTFWNRKTL